MRASAAVRNRSTTSSDVLVVGEVRGWLALRVALDLTGLVGAGLTGSVMTSSVPESVTVLSLPEPSPLDSDSDALSVFSESPSLTGAGEGLLGVFLLASMEGGLRDWLFLLSFSAFYTIQTHTITPAHI